jgi:hypothetical protein
VTNGRARTKLGDPQRSSPWVWLNCEMSAPYAVGVLTCLMR